MARNATSGAAGGQRNRWLRWLQVVLTVVLAYALFLVVAGATATRAFSALGFGPPSGADGDVALAYLRLPFMVLGAVLAGWALTMLVVVRGPLREGAPWALAAIAGPVALWFTLDTTMSLILGFPTHALFNLPFALALGIPLLALRSR